jgi:hypothetical protein
MQRWVSTSSWSKSLSNGGRHLGVKISLLVLRERAYLASVEWMRFLRAARDLEKAIRVRGSSLSSRMLIGGIHTEGSLPR